MRQKRLRGFTVLEVMIAIGIFSIIIFAIYATWTAILKGSRAGLNAAAAVQRARIAVHTLQDAFLTVQFFTENPRHYSFLADTSGDMAAVSMVSRLPASFPGVGMYGDQLVRRISFYTQVGPTGGTELVMTQAPMLLQTNNGAAEPYSLVLAKDVSLFTLEFWDAQKNEWADEWLYTNQLPRMVAITLGTGKVSGAASTPQDVVTRVVAIPAAAIGGLQGGQPLGAGQGGQPGQDQGRQGQDQGRQGQDQRDRGRDRMRDTNPFQDRGGNRGGNRF
jgi:prepilin-type N-terminal cleavage/methylation domain-containing protein